MNLIKNDVKEKIINNKAYVVKSVYIGDKNIKDKILKLAENKTIREMGLDNFYHNKDN